MWDRYITTTLPYANSKPHIGHALEFVQAQALVTHFKETEEHVFFNVGVDEHGTKVWEKAAELGVPVEKYLDDITAEWQNFCSKFEINYDEWYRTSSEYHKHNVTKFWKQCLERGDLYKRKYVGQYCVGCEAYKTDKELVDGKCPDHRTVPQVIEEENWFFRVTKYKDKLLKWLDSHPDFLSPAAKIPELRNQILEAEDISVSRLRKNVPWGIPVPSDEVYNDTAAGEDNSQVMYVWFEALLNYIYAPAYWRTGLKVNCEYEFTKFKHFVQVCGPDNIRFQGLLFQSFLEAGELPHTEKLLVHGTVLDKEGKKMSKTVGNVIDPINQIEKYGLDAVKYYMLAGLSTTGNGSWNEDDLVKLYNSDLANDFGNLVSRVLHLIDKFQYDVDLTRPRVETEFKEITHEKVQVILGLWDKYEIQQALQETNKLFQFGNKYIDSAKPWDGKSEYALRNLHYLLSQSYRLYKPVLSKETLSTIWRSLQDNKKVVIFPRLTIKSNEENIKVENIQAK